ncbi:hypothetical protein KPB05_37435 [Burkholderia gladioli]|uniref:hypothetical protein n=1 Tax=Burkholderia gladioli TaxID=28095 RepID=UPI00286651CD|nr:hypothetical protein [Burkholderia gladioli]MDR8093143.1 hypothetical protein [Burkholderia gladioli]
MKPRVNSSGLHSSEDTMSDQTTRNQNDNEGSDLAGIVGSTDATIEKLDDALTPGFVAEFAPAEADRAGAFREDALGERDAFESIAHASPFETVADGEPRKDNVIAATFGARDMSGKREA